MTYLDYYRCSTCDHLWFHLWDTEDYNNDSTCCPNCLSLDFYEIEELDYFDEMTQRKHQQE
jgi:DNA-directed RNA polymerase subunit RPC12/RpoP